MSQLPYVLLVLFAMPDGGHAVMKTAQQYDTPLSCSTRAFIENDQVTDRTYVCVTRDDAESLLRTSRQQTARTPTRR